MILLSVICYSVPMKSPVIVAKCCRNILWCQGCVDKWYSEADQMTKLCPICRAERDDNSQKFSRIS